LFFVVAVVRGAATWRRCCARHFLYASKLGYERFVLADSSVFCNVLESFSSTVLVHGEKKILLRPCVQFQLLKHLVQFFGTCKNGCDICCVGKFQKRVSVDEFQDCSSDEAGDNGDKVFNVVDAFAVPRLSYSVDRKKFLPEASFGVPEPEIYAGGFLYHRILWFVHVPAKHED
jgi:hypothetical protein